MSGVSTGGTINGSIHFVRFGDPAAAKASMISHGRTRSPAPAIELIFKNFRLVNII
ncbi:MAG: hypothetical protein WA148_03825 [Actinomycetota bacterium]